MASFEGGCLCGAIRYRVDGEPMGAVACHCRDCQHLAAGGPANIVMMRRSDVAVSGATPREWSKKGDSGRGITRAFCEICGTPLFITLEALPEGLGLVVGGLDDPSAFRPGMELWLSSAPPWHPVTQGVPQFEKGPVRAG